MVHADVISSAVLSISYLCSPVLKARLTFLVIHVYALIDLTKLGTKCPWVEEIHRSRGFFFGGGVIQKGPLISSKA